MIAAYGQQLDISLRHRTLFTKLKLMRCYLFSILSSRTSFPSGYLHSTILYIYEMYTMAPRNTEYFLAVLKHSQHI